jgi:hypothetical protein
MLLERHIHKTITSTNLNSEDSFEFSETQDALIHHVDLAPKFYPIAGENSGLDKTWGQGQGQGHNDWAIRDKKSPRVSAGAFFNRSSC